MPKAFQIETRDKDKPIILIVGDRNPLIPKLIEEYSKDFTVALVSNLPVTNGENSPYRISTQTAGLIKNLEEKIGYAVIFLEHESQRRYLQPVFEKLVEDGAKCALILSTSNQGEFYDIVAACKKLANFYFLFSSDIYSEELDFNRDSNAADIIDQAVHKKEVILHDNDLKPLFSIYVKDAISGISHVILGPKKAHKYYYLFYSHPQTYISALNLLERNVPGLEITYKAENLAGPGILEYERDIQSRLAITPVYLDRYFEGFEKSIHHFTTRAPIFKKQESKVSHASKKAIRSQKPKFKFFANALIIAFIFFLFANFAAATFSIVLFKNSLSDLQSGKYSQARNEISQSKIFFDFIDPLARVVVSAIGGVGFADIEKNYKLFATGISLINIAASDLEAVEKLPEGLPREELDQKIADAFFLYFKGQLLANETKNEAASAVLTPELSNTLTLTQVAPQVLGYDRKKTYLLLFQNNGELRPTGGFIGSVGELTLSGGKIENLDIQDVYEYDGQLKAHVEPHYILRRYIQPHLYLRDSNFEPDFQESASKSALLFSLETGRKVDGVIAINFEGVKRIIQEVGPIQLSGYDQILDDSNTFDFLQKTIDDNFFPGSTAKKDVLQSLFNQLILKLENKDSVVKIARLIPKLMREKNIMFAFVDPSVQSAFSTLGFGGQFEDLRGKNETSINDIFAVNEANIGVNKANIDVRRRTTYLASFSDTNIASTITHNLNNQSDKGYKAYIRFFTPLGSTLSFIKINGVLQSVVPAVTDYKLYERPNFVAPRGLEVDQNDQYNMHSFGFIVDTVAKSETKIEVAYRNGLTIPRIPIIDYSLWYIKQPGTESTPLTVIVNYGRNFSPKVVENATLKQEEIEINENVAIDREFKVQLIRR